MVSYMKSATLRANIFYENWIFYKICDLHSLSRSYKVTKVTKGQNFCEKIKLMEMTIFVLYIIILTQL